jgi:SAM-dependent methyltransferase
MFPILYHEHHSLYNDDLPFWLHLADQHPGSILELGCGTGRVLLPIWETGHNIVGLDLDQNMLIHCLALARKQNAASPKIFQASCTHFRIDAHFDLIIMPCNTYSTLSSADRKDTLARIKNHLIPGGVFVFGIPNPDLIKKLPKAAEPEVEEVFAHPLDGEPVQVSSSWKRSINAFTLWWDYDHLLPDGVVQRTRMEIVHHLYPPEVYLQELGENGLIPIQLWGDYDRTTYKSSSPNLIIQVGLA